MGTGVGWCTLRNLGHSWYQVNPGTEVAIPCQGEGSPFTEGWGDVLQGEKPGSTPPRWTRCVCLRAGGREPGSQWAFCLCTEMQGGAPGIWDGLHSPGQCNIK